MSGTIHTFFSQPRLRLALVSLLLALLLAFIFLLPHNPGAFRAIPSQSSVLIEFNGLVKVGNQVQKVTDKTWKNLLHSTLFQNCWTEIAAASRLFQHEADAKASFAKNKMLAAFSLHPADSLQALFVLELGATISLEKTLKTNALTKKFFPYQFRGQTLFTVHLPQNERLVVANKGHLLIFSRFSYLVEDALTQLENNRGWWADNRYLGDLNQDAGLRLFFRPDKWLAQNKGSLYPMSRPIVQTLSDNLVWAGIAWDGQKTDALCEPRGFLAELGAWKGSGRSEIYNFFPDNTALVAWAGFNNKPLFFKQLLKDTDADFTRFVLPWVGQEAALLVTEPLSESMSDDRLLLLSVRDSTKAIKSLESYGKARGLLAQGKIGMFDVFGFQGRALPGPFFSKEDKAFQNPYCAHLGKYVAVAPNRASLELFIEKYISNQTLAQNTDFLQLAQQLKPNGRALLVLNGGYLPRILQQMFQDRTRLNSHEKDIRAIAGVGWMAAELSPSFGRKVEVKLSAQTQNIQAPRSNVYWKTALSAPASTPIQIIPQPGLPEGAAILVQDKQSQLYCLNPDGEIVWQKSIGEQIIGSVQGIDYFQNGRNCYLFNTKSQVWIIDEKGKEVQGYPLQLKSIARTGLSAVNFDKIRAFSYFVCCENGNAYGFDAYGRALDGWNPQANIGQAVSGILHFQHIGKDYLVALGNKGELSVFGRDGKLRFPKVSLPGTFGAGAFLDKSTGQPRIACLSEDGVLYSCDLEGKHSVQSLIGKPHQPPLVATCILQDGKQAVAVLTGKQLTSFKMVAGKAQKVFSQQIGAIPDALFTLESRWGLSSTSNGKIILLDQAGKPVKGFPLAGSTPFGYCRLAQQKLLITGNGSAVFAYTVED
jgi:Protein of unknown function (DUF3352)